MVSAAWADTTVPDAKAIPSPTRRILFPISAASLPDAFVSGIFGRGGAV